MNQFTLRANSNLLAIVTLLLLRGNQGTMRAEMLRWNFIGCYLTIKVEEKEDIERLALPSTKQLENSERSTPGSPLCGHHSFTRGLEIVE